ncbi:glycosyltransferase [Nitrosopumilus sp.]|uniref:PseG/SpsG family protein n=1 Tax=Nitrosopumilus sp. TaxID=2024843 RepID=UPI002623FBEC|nr:glycosyltransferase [Nitrosopumilus sp.]
MKSYNFIFVVDGNNKIGLGHVYRSTNLADQLIKNKHKVHFLTTEKISKTIISRKHKCTLLSKINNLKSISILKSFNPDLIIIDKLNEKKINLKFFKKFAKVASIDYVGKNYELIDYGINYLYPSSKVKNSFSGFEYVILNKKFTSKIKIKKNVTSILVLQGGSDTYCFIPKILSALNNLDNKFKISIVLGASFQCWSKLNKILSESNKNIKILKDISNMPVIMKKHDLAITAGGNTLMELAYLGIPSIIVCGEKFENETAKLMEKKHFGKNLGFGNDVSLKQIEKSVRDLMLNYDLRLKMNYFGKRVVDGKGSKRIVTLLENFCRQKSL